MLRDMNVTFETAKRLKEAWFPQQPKNYGLYFVESFTAGGKKREWGSIVAKFGIDTILVGSFRGQTTIIHNCCKIKFESEKAFFAPTATDILAHLPGWYLTFSNGEWVCLSFDNEGNAPDTFRSSNPAEAASDAWFFVKTQETRKRLGQSADTSP